MSVTDTTETWPGAPAPAAPDAPPPTPSHGETVIAPGVLATVARKAASEVDGVEIVNGSGLLFRRQGATADVGGNRAAVELRLAVRWPRPVAEVTARVRDRVREQVRTLTGYEVTDVDITIDRLPQPASRRAGRRVE